MSAPSQEEVLKILVRDEAEDDQHWAEGVDWAREMDVLDLISLRVLLYDKEPDDLIEKMSEMRAMAKCVQNLAVLALNEIVRRKFRADLEAEGLAEPPQED